VKAFAVSLLLMLFVVVPSAAQQTVEDKVPAPSRVPEVGSKDIPVGQLRLTGTVHVVHSSRVAVTVGQPVCVDDEGGAGRRQGSTLQWVGGTR